ncbi:MAG: hypothetical protein HC890_05040 [Chloroflexaceae bacterium]|nr:hypothetical protein [Chloroflexaceae bacterium]
MQATTPAATLRLEGAPGAVEVLFPALRDGQTGTIRYEIRYEPGFTVTLAEGAQTWSAAYGEDYNLRPWQPPLFWSGVEWHWGGDRFCARA